MGGSPGPRTKKGTGLFREDSTPTSVSGHLKARRAQAVSAPLRDFDQQFAFRIGRDGRPKLVERGCERGYAVFRRREEIKKDKILKHAQRLKRKGSAIAKVDGDACRATFRTWVPSFNLP